MYVLYVAMQLVPVTIENLKLSLGVTGFIEGLPVVLHEGHQVLLKLSIEDDILEMLHYPIEVLILYGAISIWVSQRVL